MNQSRRVGRCFPATTQAVLRDVKPGDWRPCLCAENCWIGSQRSQTANQDRAQIALVAGGEHVASEATCSFLRLPMKILSLLASLPGVRRTTGGVTSLGVSSRSA